MLATSPIEEWIQCAVVVLEGSPKLATPDRMFFRRAARLRPEQWTPNELSATWARLAPYRELLRAAGLRWRPAPTFESTGPVVADEALRAGFEAGRFVLRFPYEHACTPAVRAIEGCRWDKDARAWVLAPCEAAAEAMEGLVATAGFTLDEQAEAAIAEIRLRAVETRMASRAAQGAFHVGGLAGELRPYQQAGVRYLVAAKKAFLADDMGLGKTVQALAVVQALDAWPAIVTTLASCKGGWEQECRRWLPGVRVELWEGRVQCAQTAPDAVGGRVLHVINYDLLAHRIAELKEIGAKAVIFDECHHLKNGKAKRTAAAKALVRRVPVRLGLSGTPVQNHPSELLSQLQILGRLNDMGGFWKFGMRYCEAKQARHGWDFSGAANLPELHERLRGLCFVRRTKVQVLTELPAKLVTRVPIGMSPDGWMSYEAARKDVVQWLAEKGACDPAWEATIAHLSADERGWARAERIAAAVERMDGMELLLRLGTLRQVVAEGKLTLAKEWIREMCASRKLVLFAHHKAVLRALLDEFREELGAMLIDGDTPAARRQGLVREFREDGHRLMLLNLIAGGTGLDGLQHAASDVAFLEFPWSPAGLEQAGSRLHRMGQAGTVHEWHLTAPGTVDDELLGILAAKARVCDVVNDGRETRKNAAAAIARTIAKRLRP